MSATEDAGPDADIAPFDRSSDNQFRASGKECYIDNCPGELYYHEEALVCGVCATVTGLDTTSSGLRVDKMEQWDAFHRDRPRYPQSNRVKMVGGFLQAYEWVTSDEHDGAVRELSGHEFYR